MYGVINKLWAFVFVTGICCTASAVNMEKLVSKQDLMWDEISSDYYSSALLGNGISGAAIMADETNTNALCWSLGRMDIIAHHTIEEIEYCDNRLIAGTILLEPKNKLKSRNMRLDLLHGEAVGKIVSDAGSANWKSLVDRKHDVVIVAIKGRKGEKGLTPTIRPEWGITPVFGLREGQPRYDPNEWLDQLPPKPTHEVIEDGISLVKQPLVEKGAYAIAYAFQRKRGETILYVAMGAAFNPDRDREMDLAVACDDAKQRVEAAMAEGYPSIRKRHHAWWKEYMLQSSLHIPDDKYWQSFWWRQVYKFGATSNGEHAHIIDNEGVWAWKCAWGGIWWNLNVQLSYFPAFSANRLDVGRSLLNGIDRIHASGAFHQNAREILQRPDVNDAIGVGRGTTQWGNKAWGNELGNLAWALHNYWRYWRYTMDESVAERVFKLLVENVNFYRYRLIENKDGSIHLPPTRSPEYHGKSEFQNFPDTNYALQSFDWALGALMELNDRYGYNHPLRPEWERIRKNLTPFPENENGWMVNAQDGFDKSHRHYSHMLTFYPYHTTDPSNPICEKSLERWINMEEALAGYSFTGSSAMYSTLGNGERAIEQLDKLKPRLSFNTLYREGGGPVIETPLSAVETINYFVLQSWGDVVRVFPALPKRWKSGSFKNLRAEGAFLVSGKWENGQPEELTVESLAGEPLVLEPGFNVPLEQLKISGGSLKEMIPGRYTAELKKGDTLRIRTK